MSVFMATAIDFTSFDATLLDLDGTLLRHDRPLPGAAELVEHLRDRRVRFAVITNSTHGADFLAKRLQNAGIEVQPDEVWSAARAACDHVVRRFEGRRPRVFNLGALDMEPMLEGRGAWVDGGACEAVIAGTPDNERAGPDRQRVAVELLRGGAELVGVCADRLFPSTRGIEIGCGSFCAMLAHATGREPTFCGKPEARFFLELCEKLKVSPGRCLIVGDNLESDIAGAKLLGTTAALVMTGVARPEDVDATESSLRPDVVVESLPQLMRAT